MLSAAKQDSLLHHVAIAQHEKRIPSIIAGITFQGKLVWSGSRGVPEPSTNLQYRIGSVTKILTAMLVLQLRDKGSLSLDEPIDRYISGTSVGNITLRQLLAHRSGLLTQPFGQWWCKSPIHNWEQIQSKLTKKIDELLIAQPGERIHYSNIGYALVGRIVENVSGSSWWNLLSKAILQPLDMGRTTYFPKDPAATGYSVHPHADLLLEEKSEDFGVLAPSAQLWSTLDDLARLTFFLCDPSPEVLHSDSVAEMFSAWPGGVHTRPAREETGLGVWRSVRDNLFLVGHTGGVPGFESGLYVSPDNNVGALVLTNGTYGLDPLQLCASLINDFCADELPIPQTWVPVDAIPDSHEELLGNWYWTSVPTIIVSRNNNLELHSPPTRNGRIVLQYIAPDLYRVVEGDPIGENLRVFRDSSGNPTHFSLRDIIYTRTPG